MTRFSGSNTTNFGGSSPSGNFVPTIFSKNVQMFFRRTSVIDAVTNSDYFGEISSYGDTVRLIKEPTITVSDYLRGDTLTSQALADDQVTLTLDQAKHYQFQVDDIEQKLSHIDWESLATGSATYSLKNDYDSSVLNYIHPRIDKSGVINGAASAAADIAAAIVVASQETNTIKVKAEPGSGETDPLDLISDLALNLNQKDVPAEGRWIVVPYEMQHALTQVDSKMINADWNVGPENIKNGMIAKNLHGFEVYVSNNTPTYTSTGSGAAAGHIIMAGHKSAVAAVNSLVKTEKFRHPNTFADVVRGLHVYGRSILRPNAIATAYVRFIA